MSTAPSPATATSSVKAALEELLRARRLQAEAPPLRGEDRRRRPLPTGVAAIDAALGGGLPRGLVSEAYGPASSGRTGLALALLARTTQQGGLAAWVDPADQLDPAAASAAGVDLRRLLWLRGRRDDTEAAPCAVAAVATLVGSGLFDVIVLDVAGVPTPALRRLPGPTWLRLGRAAEEGVAALLVLAREHLASLRGASLALEAARPDWMGQGPGRLLRGLDSGARVGRLDPRRAALTLQALPVAVPYGEAAPPSA